MTVQSIYMCGVGGQGIGVLAEVVVRACLAAGCRVRGADTHGLAQRGGVVVSHLRLGDHAFTPRIPAGKADLVFSLERLEAYRATVEMLRDGGAVVYYDVEFQPIHVRMGKSNYPSAQDVAKAAERRQARIERVLIDDLPDPRMQNTAVLGRVASLSLIEGVGAEHFENALGEVLKPVMLAENMAIFHQAAATTTA
jgi:indolepyruvate ferredoxin oxidoreductase beta subunit